MYFFISSTSQSAKEINMKHMNPQCSENCIKSIIDGRLQCNCGEDIGVFNWTWSKSNSSSNAQISNDDKDILFHPLYSSGTAAVRGDTAFQPNLHYYWEIKMISNLYGTDVMVGVGTSKIVLSDWKYKFCSMLGIDSQSYGYSYHGNVQHNHLVRKYGSRFGLGSVVGVHLNMCNGTLEYYVNRKPMGIAFRGLKNKELYPMVSSTAAQSAMKMICAVSEEPTLQLLCLEFISKHPALYAQYKDIPGLIRLYKKRYFWIVPTNEEDEARRVSELDKMCPMNYTNVLKQSKNYHTIRWFPLDVRRTREEQDSAHGDSDVELPPHRENSISVSTDDSSTSSSASHSVSTTSVSILSEDDSDASQNKIRRIDSEESIIKELLSTDKPGNHEILF